MKANELMIGDLVIDTEFERNKADVIEIVEPTRVWLSGGKTYTPIEHIEPIPLTPEILEKNGFVIKKKWAQRGNFGDSPLIMWHFEDNPLPLTHDYKHELEIHDNSTGKTHVEVPCEYVHQLQHALRLCGIDKEIIL